MRVEQIATSCLAGRHGVASPNRSIGDLDVTINRLQDVIPSRLRCDEDLGTIFDVGGQKIVAISLALASKVTGV